MRAQINRKFPDLAQYIQPKCGDKRWGYCDESVEDWEKCPIGKKRPQKKMLFELFDQYRRGEVRPMDNDDFTIIESIGSSVVHDGTPPAKKKVEPEGDAPPSTRDEG